MQATVKNPDIPATIRRVPHERGVSRRRQVPGGIVGRPSRCEEVLERINRVSATNASSPGESKTSTYDDGLSAFLSVRPRLFGIAYRMLGSAAEAEDIVQDVWVRWQTADRSQVRDAAAFLMTTTTRLAINVMQSARSRRETYVGPWLPEPVDTSADPRLGAERGEALAFGVLMLLEKLTPTERAAYVLREAFDYAYRDIANVLRLEEANARQVVTRARQHVANGRKMPANSTEQRRLLVAFIAAAQDGDVAGLEGLFASEVVSTADGRGLVRAARPDRQSDPKDALCQRVAA
jgi:RNA polymerase sigma-70 factor (ECF subfamily)